MRSSLLAKVSVASLCAASIAAGVLAPQQALAAAATPPRAPKVGVADTLSLKERVFTDAGNGISAMATQSSPADTQFFADGRFQYVDVACPRCELGPAVAAAALYRRTGDPSLLKLSTTAIDTVISTRQQSDGAFVAKWDTIQTAFIAESIGATLYYLGPTLDAARRQAWTDSLARAADALITQKMMGFYANGNINLVATVAMGMAWKQTGLAKYKTAYDAALAFTLNPGPNWSGFGLKTTKQGKLSLGRDTSAYLAEKMSGRAAGYDPDYTQLQADIAASGWQVIGDSRLLMLTHQLNNQLLALVDTTTWALDVSHGSRHPDVVGFNLYTTPALYITATATNPQTLPLANQQVRAATARMRESATTPRAGNYQDWGTEFALFIWAVR